MVVEESGKIPVYFGIAVWGRAFRESFVNNALASLLADGNIPALNNSSGKNRFLIYTTYEDKRWIEKQALIKLLMQYMDVEFLEMTPILEGEYLELNNALNSSKLYTMTMGHLQIVNRMYKDKAIGSIVLADSIYSNNSIRSAHRYILDGKKGVLVFCPRFSTDKIVDSLIEQKYIQLDTPLTIEPRDLVKVAIDNLHVDMLMEQWEAPYIPEFMMEAGWLFPDKSGMLFQTWSCWCAFINYSQLLTHNVESLGRNTVDGVYFGANLNKEDVHLITDSDEFTLISYSPNLSRRIYPINIFHNSLSKTVISGMKISFVKNFLKGSISTHTDIFKLAFASHTIFMHTKDLTPDCLSLASNTKAIMNKVFNEKTPFHDKFVLKSHTSFLRYKKELIYINKRLYNSGLAFFRSRVYPNFLVVIKPMCVFLSPMHVFLSRVVRVLSKVIYYFALGFLSVFYWVLLYSLAQFNRKKGVINYIPIPNSHLENSKN